MAALGLVFGLLINVRLATKNGIDEDKAWNLGMLVILAGVLGAKVLLVLTDLDRFLQHPRDLLSLYMLQAGGVWYGGLIAGAGVGVWYVWRNRIPALKALDSFAPGISLGHGLGRLGCLAAGCCYGRETDAPWAIVFTNLWANKTAGTPLGVHLHPTQIYEFLAEMLICTTLLWLFRRRTFDGQVAGTYAFLYGVARFIIEFYRGDPDRGTVFNGLMSTSQLIAIGMVFIGGVLWVRRRPATPEPAPAAA